MAAFSVLIFNLSIKELNTTFAKNKIKHKKYDMEDNVSIKEIYAGVSLLAAIGFGVAGMAIPPLGVIDGTTLGMIGQFLIFSATLLGLGATYKKISNLVRQIKKDGNRDKGNAK